MVGKKVGIQPTCHPARRCWPNKIDEKAVTIVPIGAIRRR
jgi:hypothetical protein